MKLRTPVLACLIALCSSLAAAGVIRDGSLRADARANGVALQWVSDNETGVAYYLVERSTQGGDGFIVINQRFAAKGSGQSYVFLDETAFKTTDTFYRYRITPLDASGGPVGGMQFYTQVITKSPSSVRRTWGSIKAMFR